MKRVKGYLEKIADAVCPGGIYCISCGAVTDRSNYYGLCHSCLNTFHFATGRVCKKCGKMLEEGYVFDSCRDCRKYERKFEKGYCCMLYGLYEKEVIKAFKYGDKAYFGRFFGEIMYDRIEPVFESEVRADVIVPVPIHRSKLAKRGYNQSEILAREISDRLGIPMCKALERVEKTRAMSRISGRERRDNLESAFVVPSFMKQRLTGKRVLLVDDIFTSGSTADACSEVLKNAGASAIIVLALAAGGNV